MDPHEYCRLRLHLDLLQNAVTLLKGEICKKTQPPCQTVAANRTNNGITPQPSFTNSSSINNRKSSTESLFEVYGLGSSSTTGTQQIQTTWTIGEEIGFYTSSINVQNPPKFSEFWFQHEKSLPLMSAVVRRVKITPVSSVPCESTFSIAGYIKRIERCSLDEKTTRYSMVLKDHHKLQMLKQ